MERVRNSREGFSLIEMIITIAIVGIVMASVILLVSYSTNSMRRTTNSVNLQNETKDALLHMTTYVQEGSDAYWDADKKALIVAKKIKNLEGDPVSLEVSHYWFHADSTTPATPDPSATETRGVICFYKEVYDSATDTNWATRFKEDKSLNFANLIKDYDGLVSTEGIETLMFAKNVIEFSCVVNENTVGAIATVGPTTDPTVTVDPSATTPPPVVTPDSSVTPDPSVTSAPSPTPISIGGKFVVVTINMKNEMGDAQFESTKEIFLRNR